MTHEAPPQPEPPASAPAAPVATGTLCMTCQYDLAGLERQGNYPECGGSITDTLDASLPGSLARAYVPDAKATRIRAALVWVIAGQVLWLALGLQHIFAIGLVSRAWGIIFYALLFGALICPSIGWMRLLREESTNEAGFIPVLSESRGKTWIAVRYAASLTLAAALVVPFVVAEPRREFSDAFELCILANLLTLTLWVFVRQHLLLGQRLARLRCHRTTTISSIVWAITLIVPLGLVWHRPGESSWAALIGTLALFGMTFAHAAALYVALGDGRPKPPAPGQQ